MGERQELDHAEAWERDAERQDLENQRNGLLRELLDGPLAGELEQLVADAEARAEEGLVELNNPDGRSTTST